MGAASGWPGPDWGADGAGAAGSVVACTGLMIAGTGFWIAAGSPAAGVAAGFVEAAPPAGICVFSAVRPEDAPGAAWDFG